MNDSDPKPQGLLDNLKNIPKYFYFLYVLILMLTFFVTVKILNLTHPGDYEIQEGETITVTSTKLPPMTTTETVVETREKVIDRIITQELSTTTVTPDAPEEAQEETATEVNNHPSSNQPTQEQTTTPSSNNEGEDDAVGDADNPQQSTIKTPIDEEESKEREVEYSE